MRLSAKMVKLLNEQISMEAEASNFYLSIASWCEVTGYEGAAKFFYQQSDEERDHMLKVVHYVNDMGTQATIPPVKEPQKNIKSLESIIKTSLKNEQEVTKSIHEIVSLADKEKDPATFEFMQWFVKEQTEEEATFETVLQKFDVIGRDKLAVYEIDKYMSSVADSKSAPAE